MILLEKLEISLLQSLVTHNSTAVNKTTHINTLVTCYSAQCFNIYKIVGQSASFASFTCTNCSIVYISSLNIDQTQNYVDVIVVAHSVINGKPFWSELPQLLTPPLYRRGGGLILSERRKVTGGGGGESRQRVSHVAVHWKQSLIR